MRFSLRYERWCSVAIRPSRRHFRRSVAARMRANRSRIAVAGHSFGGQLTLLAAERDPTIRAAVSFAGAAGSWQRSAELRDRLLAAFAKRTQPLC